MIFAIADPCLNAKRALTRMGAPTRSSLSGLAVAGNTSDRRWKACVTLYRRFIETVADPKTLFGLGDLRVDQASESH
jgi:hypothetical protein